MNGSKQFFVGVLLSVGLLSNVHAVYVGGNPLSNVDPKGLQSENPFGQFIPPNPYSAAYQRRSPDSPPTAAELACMRKYIQDHYPPGTLALTANFSVMSYFDNNGNLVDGGATAAWLDAAEIGGLKGSALVAMIQGGKLAQSAAVTSEMMGMGGSASVGMFVAGTKARALGVGIEAAARRVGVPAAVIASILNADARDKCGCGQ